MFTSLLSEEFVSFLMGYDISIIPLGFNKTVKGLTPERPYYASFMVF
jgi:hypothetical protein